MVNHDVSDNLPGGAPGTLLVARLHVDLCRLTSAACRRCDRARD
ncbi:putative leader peptide [Streptomyces macrosporus]